MGEIQSNPSHVAQFNDINLGDVEVQDETSGLKMRVLADAATILDSVDGQKTLSCIFGYDGADWRRISVDATGNMNVVISGGLPLNTTTMSAPGGPVVVGVASTPLVAANANRKFLSISVVTSGARVSLGLDGNAAVLDAGITLYTAGTYVFDAMGLTTGAIEAISSIAATNVGYQEGV